MYVYVERRSSVNTALRACVLTCVMIELGLVGLRFAEDKAG